MQEFTKEPHVPERRSILRGFKKYFARKEFDDIRGTKGRPFGLPPGADNSVIPLKELYEGLEDDDLINVQNYMDICRNTQSADHYRKKTQNPYNGNESVYRCHGKSRYGKTSPYMYEPLVGDPCYRYNKLAKERFFKNVYLSYLFVQFTYYNGNDFIVHK